MKPRARLKEELAELDSLVQESERQLTELQARRQDIEERLRNDRIAWLRNNAEALLSVVDHSDHCDNRNLRELQPYCMRCVLETLNNDPDVYIPPDYDFLIDIRIKTLDTEYRR